MMHWKVNFCTTNLLLTMQTRKGGYDIYYDMKSSTTADLCRAKVGEVQIRQQSAVLFQMQLHH
jgi:hypothetical protein